MIYKIFILKKLPEASQLASSKASSILKTEWLPINVLPKCISREIENPSYSFYQSAEDDEDADHLMFNLNNPFLRNESYRKGKKSVR